MVSILAILVGMLAPSMTKYVEKAKLARANVNAEVVYDYVAEYLMECQMENTGNGVSTNLYRIYLTKYDGTEILYIGDSTNTGNAQPDFVNYMKKCLGTSETKQNKAPFVLVKFTEDGKIEYVTWASKQSDKLVGSSPVPAVGRSTKRYQSLNLPNTGDS